jgi:hypothetical protein
MVVDPELTTGKEGAIFYVGHIPLILKYPGVKKDMFFQKTNVASTHGRQLSFNALIMSALVR